jgi:hypothetical protein
VVIGRPDSRINVYWIRTDAKAGCQGYADHVSLPPVGSHVRIVGRFVQDTFHQGNEIHPVTSITVIPQIRQHYA